MAKNGNDQNEKYFTNYWETHTSQIKNTRQKEKHVIQECWRSKSSKLKDDRKQSQQFTKQNWSWCCKKTHEEWEREREWGWKRRHIHRHTQKRHSQCQHYDSIQAGLTVTNCWWKQVMAQHNDHQRLAQTTHNIAIVRCHTRFVFAVPFFLLFRHGRCLPVVVVKMLLFSVELSVGHCSFIIFRQFFNIFFFCANMFNCSRGMSTNSLKFFKFKISFSCVCSSKERIGQQF